jgi:hypothetical protein
VEVPFGVTAELVWPRGSVALAPGRSAHRVALEADGHAARSSV